MIYMLVSSRVANVANDPSAQGKERDNDNQADEKENVYIYIYIYIYHER